MNRQTFSIREIQNKTNLSRSTIEEGIESKEYDKCEYKSIQMN
jgi:transposase